MQHRDSERMTLATVKVQVNSVTSRVERPAQADFCTLDTQASGCLGFRV